MDQLTKETTPSCCAALGKMIMKQKRESQTPLACIKQLVFHSQLVPLHLEQALPKAQVSAALHAFCITPVIVAPPGGLVLVFSIAPLGTFWAGSFSVGGGPGRCICSFDSYWNGTQGLLHAR